MITTQPALTICIPTYNRAQQLKNLTERVLAYISANYKADVEIIVCDNSCDAIAKENHDIVSSFASYYKNQKNIGYAGNVAKLVSLAAGKYIWLISDDDELTLEGVDEVVAFSQQGKQDMLLLRFTLCGKVVNHSGIVTGGVGGVENYILNNFPPFTLLSTAVFKINSREDMISSLTEFDGNHYIQAPLIVSAMGSGAMYKAAEKIAIIYNSDKNGRFDIVELDQSLVRLTELFARTHGLNLQKMQDLCLRFAMRHKLNEDVGIYRITENTSVREYVWRNRRRATTWFGRAMLCILLMPKPIRSFITTIWIVCKDRRYLTELPFPFRFRPKFKI